MNYIKGLFGDRPRCSMHMTFVIAESHMNPISICKDFIMKTYYKYKTNDHLALG